MRSVGDAVRERSWSAIITNSGPRPERKQRPRGLIARARRGARRMRVTSCDCSNFLIQPSWH
jgi:lysophospholipid acyltransferase (LPLAT)-like uncharacterized protein